jgi:tRNA pseudouridine55 synthase
VLPIVVGRATRLARFLTTATKTYLADIKLGVETDTLDATGQPGPECAPACVPSRSAIARALEPFRGVFEQVPPAFSAKKVGGRRAYDLARRDLPVGLRPVRVTVHGLEVRHASGDALSIVLTCSSGFYVRALARDLGRALGCGAHLTALRRTRSGEFCETQAVPLLAAEEDPGRLSAGLIPLEGLLGWMPAAHLGGDGVTRARHGNTVPGSDVERWAPAHPVAREAIAEPVTDPGQLSERSDGEPSGLVRLFAPDGQLIAVARREAATGSAACALHPFVVLV